MDEELQDSRASCDDHDYYNQSRQRSTISNAEMPPAHTSPDVALMPNAPTIAIISPGAMGAAVAKRLSAHGCRVLTDLSGRSTRSQQRAAESGMQDAPSAAIIREARYILSIVPPDRAEPLARNYLEIWKEAASENKPDTNLNDVSDWKITPPIFVDCNAKSPETTVRLAGLFSSDSTLGDPPFLNACIIGLPPLGEHNPTFYASAEQTQTNQRALEEFGALGKYGLDVKLLMGEDSDLCDASALKMTFSGIMKGMIALYEIMILSAHAYSPRVAAALLREMQVSLPHDLEFIDTYVQQSFGKSYRFVHEMEEMADFLRQNVDSGVSVPVPLLEASSQPSHPIAQIFDGFAGLYGRLAESVAARGSGRNDGLSDIDVLDTFVSRARAQDL